MEKYSQELESKEVALGTNDCLCLSVREVVGLYCTKDLKLKLLSRGIGMNLLFGLDASSLIRLNSATVSLFHAAFFYLREKIHPLLSRPCHFVTRDLYGMF